MGKKETFEDYDGFVNKFETKKTTDDCYTPAEVYDCVLNYVRAKVDITGCEIVRPFYPGGDYENYDYPKGCVVIDNPPFSIITQITKYYQSVGIKFFLFAPHLTLFGAGLYATSIVCGADVTYENGAIVKTSFVSNLFGHTKVIGDPALLKVLEKINERDKVNLPKYRYPDEVLTVSAVQWIISRGIYYEVSASNCEHIRALDSQRKLKKSIFGSGFLLSKKAAVEKAAVEKAAAEKAAAEKATAIVWELSDKEREIVNELGELI